MPSETQFNVNLPHDARLLWDKRKIGLTHIRMAMAGLAAYAVLEREVQDEITTLVASVQEKGEPYKR